MEQELKEARTMSDVFRVCEKHYNLDQPLGVATKGIVIMGVKKAIKIINAKPRKNG